MRTSEINLSRDRSRKVLGKHFNCFGCFKAAWPFFQNRSRLLFLSLAECGKIRNFSGMLAQKKSLCRVFGTENASETLIRKSSVNRKMLDPFSAGLLSNTNSHCTGSQNAGKIKRDDGKRRISCCCGIRFRVIAVWYRLMLKKIKYRLTIKDLWTSRVLTVFKNVSST